MAHFECTSCGLVLRPRGLSAAPRHCPRCVARRRAVVELTLVADSAELSDAWTSGDYRDQLTDATSRRQQAFERPRFARRAGGFHGRLTLGEDETRVRLFGELDDAAVPAVERLLREAESDNRASVVIDLRGVRFIDSGGSQAIIAACGRLGDRLTLLPGPSPVHRTFERTDAARVLPFITDAR